MRKLNGKGVVSTKEAFQTRSKTGTQHNAAMAAFSQMEGARSTAPRGPPWRAATHAATCCSRGPPACSGLPSRAERERERAEPSPPGRRGGRRRAGAGSESATLPPLAHAGTDMTTGGPKKSQLRSGWCHLSCRRRWQPQAAPGWLASSPRVVGGLPHGDSSWPVLSLTPQRSDASRCHLQAGAGQAHDPEQGRDQGRRSDAACRGHGGVPVAGQGRLTDREEAEEARRRDDGTW